MKWRICNSVEIFCNTLEDSVYMQALKKHWSFFFTLICKTKSVSTFVSFRKHCLLFQKNADAFSQNFCPQREINIYLVSSTIREYSRIDWIFQYSNGFRVQQQQRWLSVKVIFCLFFNRKQEKEKKNILEGVWKKTIRNQQTRTTSG